MIFYEGSEVLSAQLASKEAEIATLKQQLAAKEAEIYKLVQFQPAARLMQDVIFIYF